MRFQVLASGSKGNSTFFEAGDARVVVDHGISTRQLCLRLGEIGVEPESIDAIIVTHEHTDHVGGIRVWRKRFATPVIVNRPTAECIPGLKPVHGPIHFYKTGDTIDLGGVRVNTFPVSHDAADPVGLVFEWKGRRVGMVTDFGQATELVRRRLADSDALILEFNHDTDMLINGPYPWPLKDRIRRKHGHMSNDQASNLLRDIAHPGLKALVLAHLSHENNRPSLAMKCATAVLNGKCAKTKIQVGEQNCIAEPVILD